jgi:predicted dehydrogenase
LNILIVGLGSIGRKHVQSIRQIKKSAKIYALRSSSNAEQFEDVVNLFSLDELLCVIDFVIISNVSSLHEKTILEMLKLNCPLFIEKPSLSSLNTSEYILNTINNLKITTYVACNLRFHPAIIFLRNWINSSLMKINEINIYCGTYLPDWRSGVDYKKTYSANELLGGGVHLDLIHEIDYTIWIFGFPNKTNVFKSNDSTLNLNSTDSALFILKYEKFRIGINLNYYRRDSKRQIEILTEDDTIIVDLLKCKIYSNLTNKIFFEGNDNLAHTYQNQMKYFIECIEKKIEPMNNLKNSIDILKIALHENTY